MPGRHPAQEIRNINSGDPVGRAIEFPVNGHPVPTVNLFIQIAMTSIVN